MSDLQTLLDRVKKATGPDQRIEVDLVHAFFDSKEATLHELHNLRMHEYTTSIDAALALVDRLLPGWVVADLCQNSRHAGDPWGCTLAVYYGSTPSKNRSAQSGYDFPTAPLAILAALLSALISKESQS